MTQPLHLAEKRLYSLDALRALAVALMIIFHFSFDLQVFGFADIDFTRDYFWWLFPRVIVFLFLLAVGCSLAVVKDRSLLGPRRMLKRFFKLGSLALLISLFTYFAFRPSWIYFGTLHCIALCSLMAWPILLLPKMWRMLSSAAITLVLWIPVFAFDYTWPWIRMDHPSMDYIPALPWFGIVTLGILFEESGLLMWCEKFLRPLLKTRVFGPFIWMGKESLKIYMLHQPILYGLVFIAFKLLK